MVLISTHVVQENRHKTEDATGSYDFHVGDRRLWLIIETCCFYLYMLAAMIYIFVR